MDNGMQSSLFRKESQEHQKQLTLGRVSVVQPLSIRVLTWTAVVVVALIAAFLIMFSYTRRSTAVGQLTPSKGLATVLAPANGVISRVDILEGEGTSRGQSAIHIEMPKETAYDGDAAEALDGRLREQRLRLIDEQDAAKSRLKLQQVYLAQQLDAAKDELRQLSDEMENRRAQIKIADDSLERLRQLEDKRYVSVLQIKQQESSALSWKAELQMLQRQSNSARRSVSQLQQSILDIPLQLNASSAALDQNLARLEQELLEARLQNGRIVTSPIDGVVSALLVRPGQSIQVGQPMMSVVPRGAKLQGELLVPSRSIGFVREGQRVLLRFDAYPYQKFGHQEARVIRISRSAINRSMLLGSSPNSSDEEASYLVAVELDSQSILAYGKREPLKAGMKFEAEILGDSRRLFEWVMEPLYSLNGKLKS